jgi:TctA family transporter
LLLTGMTVSGSLLAACQAQTPAAKPTEAPKAAPAPAPAAPAPAPAALGAFVLNNRLFDIWVLFGFGVLGYLMVKHDLELPPFVIGFLLGPLAETNIRRALQANSDPLQFVTRPISGLLVLLTVLSVAYYLYVGLRSARQRTPAEALATEE